MKMGFFESLKMLAISNLSSRLCACCALSALLLSPYHLLTATSPHCDVLFPLEKSDKINSLS